MSTALVFLFSFLSVFLFVVLPVSLITCSIGQESVKAVKRSLTKKLYSQDILEDIDFWEWRPLRKQDKGKLPLHSMESEEEGALCPGGIPGQGMELLSKARGRAQGAGRKPGVSRDDVMLV